MTDSNNRQPILTQIKEIQKGYGANKVLLYEEMKPKQKTNFCKNCKISDPGELLGFIDTTLMGSGKDGVGFCENRIVWRNFAFEEPQSISYEKLYNASYSHKKDDLIIEINEAKFKLSTVNKKLSSQHYENIFSLLGTYWRNNCAELSEEEIAEKKLLSYLPIPDDNYFHTLWKTLNKNKLSEKNKNAKQQLQVTLAFLAIALSFPDIINRHKIYNRKLIKLFDSEYITFEILIIISKKATHMLTDAVNTKVAQALIEATIAKPLFLHYIMYKIELEKVKNGPSLKSAANPQEAIINHPISRFLKLEQRDSETDFAEQLTEKILRIIVTQSDDYFLDSLNFKDHEYDLYEICKEFFEEAYEHSLESLIKGYLDRLDHSIEKILVEFFE